jgi:hypothetical protein
VKFDSVKSVSQGLAGVRADGVVSGTEGCRHAGNRWEADTLGKGTVVPGIDEGGHGGGCTGMPTVQLLVGYRRLSGRKWCRCLPVYKYNDGS